MKYFPSLNGLRAISITIVILYHLFRFKLRLTLIALPLYDGDFGVNIFFVISGFLITSLLLQEEEITGKISIKGFYIRRTLRIFPAYFFLLLVYGGLQLIGYLRIPSMAWLTALTYTKYLNYWIDWYTGHAWSLSIEENFYLFWPMIFLLGKKARATTIILLIFIVPLIRLYVNFYPNDWMNDLSIFTRIDAIAMGCFCALKRKEIITVLTPQWIELFFFSLILLFFLPWLAAVSRTVGLGLIFITLGVLHGTIANILIAIIMMYSVFGPISLWHKILNSKLFNYVGTLSYSLYLWQQFYLAHGSNWIVQFPQSILLIFLTSIFSYYIIEKPFLKLKLKFSNKTTHHSQPIL